MRHLRYLIVLMILLMTLAPNSNASAWNGENGWYSLDPNLRAGETAPEFHVTTSDLSQTQMAVDVHGINIENVARREGTFQKITLPQTGTTTTIGDPELPQLMKLIAIPDQGGVELEVISADYETIPNIYPFPVQPTGDEQNPEPDFAQNLLRYGTDEPFPAQVAAVSEPMILRDFRVVSVTINPVQYNPIENELRVYRNIQVSLRYTNEPAVNSKTRTRSTISRAFEKIYESTIANYDQLRDVYTVEDGSYLVILPESFELYSQDLIDWRRMQGHRVVVEYMEDIGQTMPELKMYLQAAYDTWEYPPDYVLLLADENQGFLNGIPTDFYNDYAQIASDHTYTALDGDDYLSDILLGRLSVHTPQEVYNVVRKIVNYESDPEMDDPNWFERGLMVGGGSPRFVVSTIETKNWVRREMLQYGYTQVDTVYDWVFNPSPSDARENITNSVNNGVGIINYRGWANFIRWNNPGYDLVDVEGLDNGNKLPVVFSIVCGTGGYAYRGVDYDYCFGEAWLRAGSANNPAGAVGFFGSSYINTHTKWNNPMDGGIFEGLFHRDMYELGEVVLWGKMVQYLSFPGEPAAVDCEECTGDRCYEHCISFYHHSYNLLGDPAMPIWTKTPQTMTVNHPSTVPLGQNFVEIDTDIPNAWVALTRYTEAGEAEIHSTAYTCDDGNAMLYLPADVTAGEVIVAVTKADYMPYTGTMYLEQQAYQAGVYETAPEITNPNQTISYTVTLKNTGQNGLNNVTAILSTDDSYVTINTNSANYGNISAGGMASGNFEIVIHSDAPHHHLVHFDVEITDGDGHTFDGSAHLNIESALLVVESAEFGGDGYLEPGETETLTLHVRNMGAIGVDGLIGNISTQQAYVIDGQGEFGDISPDGSSSAEFSLQATGDSFIGTPIRLRVHFTDTNGINQDYYYTVYVGNVTSTSPIVPDHGEYSYFAYDDTDIVPTGYEQNVPEYNWIEIDPAYGGNGTALNLNDEFTIGEVELPFDFMFYGHDYSRLNVSPNGWIAFTNDEWWTHELTYQYNPYVYSPLAPEACVSVYWDDLHPDAVFAGCPNNIGNGDAFWYYDEANHWLIVEWSRIEKQQGCPPTPLPLGPTLTFQVILYDPDHYPTDTGDGEILCQYHTIMEGDELLDQECTVGILDHEDQYIENWHGLQYLYDSFYHPAAAPLANERAIKFTTNGYIPTSSPTSTNDVNTPRHYVLHQNVPNPFNPKTTIRYRVPTASDVKLSIYDPAGQLIQTLVNDLHEGGTYTVQWNGENEQGVSMPSGVYLYRLEAKNFSETRKMILLR